MINYRIYSVEELATDEAFRQWIINPSDEKNAFWEDWLDQNPDCQQTVHQAVALVSGIYEKYKDDLTEEAIQQEIGKLIDQAESNKNKNKLFLLNHPLLKIAAMLTLICGFGYFYYWNHFSKYGAANQTIARESFILKQNNTNKEMTVLLSDGSVATLKNGSSLRFPRKFSGNNRSVYLTGEAFFDVTKNPLKPFLVFANETVTKVLGTSFRVKALEGENTVMVLVKTGKVSVFPEKEYKALSEFSEAKTPGVILHPNQQVVFNRNDNKLNIGNVENPEMLSESVNDQEVIFDDIPVSEVLVILEKTYGINIIFDQESLSKCPVSSIFKEENLKQRMNAICQAIGATYEVVDGQIILYSKGCNH